MVFRAKGRKAWKARVRHPDGRVKVCGCDTESRETAKAMERWGKQLYSDRTPRALSVLDAILSGRTSLPRAYDGRHDLGALLVDLDDVNLEPYVARWQNELARRKKPNAEGRAKYLMQVRKLIPVGKPFPRSAFTKQRVRDWLDSLGIGQPNRYRSALSSFAQFLAFEDVLPGNPVRLVPESEESDPRSLHLSQSEAKKLIAAFTNDRHRRFHAAMLATGMEYGAAKKIDPATVTDTTVFADGSKRAWRQRTCTVYRRWKWAWDIALLEIEKYKDGERPFGGINRWSNRDALKTAIKRAGIDPNYTTHDHRHTWAVQGLRDGLTAQVVAHQLGHKDASMVDRVYGKHVPAASDFVRASAVASPVTQPRNDLKEETVT